MAKTASIFIDGEAGTTGLGIRERLLAVSTIELKSLTGDKRKDPEARRALMAEVDLVVLCLPDDAAKESVALADSLGDKAPKILDASTAYRVAPGWAYGFPELAKGHAETIAIITKGDGRTSPQQFDPDGLQALHRQDRAIQALYAEAQRVGLPPA